MIKIIVILYTEETLKKEDRKLSVFENDCLRSMVGFSFINQIKIDAIWSDIGILNKIDIKLVGWLS